MSEPGDSITRERIVREAREWCGVPYHHQASMKGVGCDCLGLLRGVYREITGVEPEAPPAYSSDWAEALGCETLIDGISRHLTRIDVADAREGDVLVFRMQEGAIAKHCGVLTGPDTIVDAMEGSGVTETHLNRWWVRRIAAAFRFPGVVD